MTPPRDGVRRPPPWSVPFLPGPIICHGDPQPANFTWRDGQAVGLFDWDAARPGDRLSDLSHALVRLTPSNADDGEIRRRGFTGVPDRQARVDAFLDGYGWTQPMDVGEVAVARRALVALDQRTSSPVIRTSHELQHHRRRRGGPHRGWVIRIPRGTGPVSLRMSDVSHPPLSPPSPGPGVVHRPADAADVGFLLQMLEGAFNWREDPGFDRSLLGRPQVAHYLTDWPTDTDFGVVAERGGRPVGAAWARCLSSGDRGYGYVSDAIPEITMAVAGAHRGQGVGRGLLDHLVDTARQLGVEGLSLSVEDGNRARRLYELVGFTVVGREGDSDTMSLTLTAGRP